ncbi:MULTISPECIES: LysR family transcriptional regulator [unclassified Pseudomonas]|uniref:LysR family transcriptional regulator n=1 Tax=unclassified Pseudomonas TaxID=196821 RepID=UPI0024496185|nr:MULTISPECIES: LysR family transcriptional regulator [unclassified Pseudomonas]MDH0896011.1 LysR family transcriptional regulator [Pseudomonas sp. GD03875]MDH1065944.1 LysR family transcriptional regulator [Pseudomonas sp. GD03985]
MNISTFDLNLLRVLDALLRERNVSRAAERLALSQPAVSNALNRLRDLLDDPLLVRVGRAMQPTPRALELEAPIRAALRQIEESLSGAERFEPARSRQRFTIALTDYAEMLLMPRLLAHLAGQAPGIRIDVQHLSPRLPSEALEKGEIDLALGRFEALPPRFCGVPWMSETLQLVAHRDHPQLRDGLDLNTFLRLRHLWVHGGQTRGMVEQWLGEQGLTREIVYTTPNYLQAAHIAASGDLVAVLPTRLARYFAGLLPLTLHALPFELGPFQLEIVSLDLRRRDMALQWLIEQIGSLGDARG